MNHTYQKMDGVEQVMKAAVINRYGKPNVFQIETVSEPSPKEDEVKIQVIASSVNPIDYKTRSGSIFFLSGWKFPRILGSDFSGVVLECGSQVKHLKVGDEVFGFSQAATKGGAYAEVMSCQATRVANKPRNLNHDEAATIPLAGLTAYQALYKEGNMTTGMQVLITGATGGVGHFAVQIAKAAGCHVTGVCHSRNKELAIQLGCDEVSPYDQIDFRKKLQRYDLIFDGVGKFSYSTCRNILKQKGTYVSTLPYPSVILLHAISPYMTGKKGRFILAHANTAELEILGSLSNDGLLNPFIENYFSLLEITKAHALSETGRVRGKIVVHV